MGLDLMSILLGCVLLLLQHPGHFDVTGFTFVSFPGMLSHKTDRALIMRYSTVVSTPFIFALFSFVGNDFFLSPTHVHSHTQVVVVTHTASVAALADQHLVVEKATADSRTPATSDSSSGGGGSPAYATVGVAAPPLSEAAAAAGEGADDFSLSAWRSRRNGMGENGGLSVSIREVQGQAREEEVARMAAGDLGGGAAAELAREMLRYSRRQRA